MHTWGCRLMGCLPVWLGCCTAPASCGASWGRCKILRGVRGCPEAGTGWPGPACACRQIKGCSVQHDTWLAAVLNLINGSARSACWRASTSLIPGRQGKRRRQKTMGRTGPPHAQHK